MPRKPREPQCMEYVPIGLEGYEQRPKTFSCHLPLMHDGLHEAYGEEWIEPYHYRDGQAERAAFDVDTIRWTRTTLPPLGTDDD